MEIKKAVIPCGGLGTRFLPFTKAVAKEMLPIIDKPCLDFIVDELVASGITDILLVISPDKEMIRRYYEPNYRLNSRLKASGKDALIASLTELEQKADFTYAVQERANGSGGAILLAEEFCGRDAFVVANGDDLMFADQPVARQLMDAYGRYGKTVLGVQRRTAPEILRYGVIKVVRELGNGAYEMDGILEKPREEDLTSDLATLGRYVIAPGIFEILHRTPIAKNGELQFTDAINIMAAEEGGIAQIFDGVRYDMGDKFGSLQAVVEYGLRDAEFGADFRAYLKTVAQKL